MMALRALTAVIALKIAVDVGLVVGTIAAMTPKGQAISMILLASSRLITPSVRTSLMDIHTFFDANWFLIVLCSATPMCVSSTAMRPETLGRFVCSFSHRRTHDVNLILVEVNKCFLRDLSLLCQSSGPLE